MGEIIFHIIVMAVLGIFLADSFYINPGRTDPVGAAGFPRTILVLALMLFAVSLWRQFRKKSADTSELKWKEWNVGYVGIIISLAAFMIVIHWLGFILSVIMLMITIFILLGRRKPFEIISFSFVISLLFAFIFGKFLSVPLPRGTGLLQELSYFIY